MKYKLVKFKDGQYGARTGFFFYKFLDLRFARFGPWSDENGINKFCKGTEAQALKAIETHDNKDCKGTPV
jgi:hypothetical protein